MKFLTQSTRIYEKTYLELQKFKGGNFLFSDKYDGFIKNRKFMFSGNWDWGRFKTSRTETYLKQGRNETWLQNVFISRLIFPVTEHRDP
jgi:hypothetical protein